MLEVGVSGQDASSDQGLSEGSTNEGAFLMQSVYSAFWKPDEDPRLKRVDNERVLTV